MTNLIKEAYQSTRLNLGIKRVIESNYWSIKYIIDNRLLYPLCLWMKTYFFHSEMFHYGADYRWGDEKSQNLDKTHENYGFGLMHYAMVRNLRPKRILCVGSMYGYVPYMLAKACMENNKGHVDFVDAAYDFNKSEYKDRHYFGQGFWKKISPPHHFSYLLHTSFISTHVLTLEEFLTQEKHQYDYIYLDGDHSYKGLIRDIRMVWPLLADKGVLGLHDIEFDFKKSLNQIGGAFRKKVEHVTFGVARIWKEFEKTSQTFPVLNGYSGIGFIRKHKKGSIPDFLL